eukprot:4349956-Ditylum_brightwellii.AAC.1
MEEVDSIEDIKANISNREDMQLKQAINLLLLKSSSHYCCGCLPIHHAIALFFQPYFGCSPEVKLIAAAGG